MEAEAKRKYLNDRFIHVAVRLDSLNWLRN